MAGARTVDRKLNTSGAEARAPRPCPYLGTAADPVTFHLGASTQNRCYGVDPAQRIAIEHQVAYCYRSAQGCGLFQPLAADGSRCRPMRATDLGTEEIGGAEPGAAKAPVSPVAFEHQRVSNGNGFSAANGEDTRAEPIEPAERVAGPTAKSKLNTLKKRAQLLSFEEWTVGLVVTGLLVVLAFTGVSGTLGLTAGAPTPEPGIQAQVEEALATSAPETDPTTTPEPTATLDIRPRETPEMPPVPPGGILGALTPAMRDVGTVSDLERVPIFGQRELHAGSYDGRNYAGLLAFSLTRLENSPTISGAQIELVGLSDANLGSHGTWTVEMLPANVDEQWANLTHSAIEAAPSIVPPIKWELDVADLRTGGVNVLAFGPEALAELRRRLDSDRPRVSFRVVGPEVEADEANIFTWDAGYGEGFGTRPTLRVAYVAPPPTAQAVAGGAPAPTALPLIIWDAVPTPAPTATSLPPNAPPVLSGMILFLSDRFGQTSLMVYDPARGRFGRVTQSWTYQAARKHDHAAAGASVGTFGRPCGTAGENGCTQLVLSRDGVQNEVTEPGYLHYDPALSPDGAWIAYTSNITGNDEIFKVRADGSDNTRLTENVWEWDKHPSFSPDGTRIVFWSNRDGRKQIYVMNADGTDQINLSGSPYNDWDPVWVK